MSDNIEQAIQAAGADRAPRVTPADIEAEIASEHYFTAKEGVWGNAPGFDPQPVIPDALGLLTFCVLVLKNGYTVTGESACASPENFNAEIGRSLARAKAIDKLWMLLGFRLRDKLASVLSDYRERVRIEHRELVEKYERPHKFIGSERFDSLSIDEQEDMRGQLAAMQANPSTKAQPERRLLRLPEVEAKVRLRRSSIYALMGRGKFPKAIKLSRRAVCWPEHVIDAWIEERIKGGGNSHGSMPTTPTTKTRPRTGTTDGAQE